MEMDESKYILLVHCKYILSWNRRLALSRAFKRTPNRTSSHTRRPLKMSRYSGSSKSRWAVFASTADRLNTSGA